MDISGDTLNDLHQAVLRAKSGDRKAFDLLYTAYLTPVYRYILIRVKNSQDTEDIVQETFLKAFQAIERYRDEKGSMLPYLFTIARNLLINHGKKKYSIMRAQYSTDNFNKFIGDLLIGKVPVYNLPENLPKIKTKATKDASTEEL